jgi:mRNA-degrading endonuclease RelE of RelBE toxin-antitoxin system
VPYPVVLKPDAVRDLKALPRDAQLRFVYALTLLGRNPTKPTPLLRIKQLRGHARFWRLAVGEWRAVYEFDGAVVRVFILGHRANVYEKFESRD